MKIALLVFMSEIKTDLTLKKSNFLISLYFKITILFTVYSSASPLTTDNTFYSS